MIQLVSPNIAQHPDCGYRKRYVSEEMAAFGYKHVERRNLTADGMKSLARDNANLRKGHMIQRHDRPIQNGKQLAWVPRQGRYDVECGWSGDLMLNEAGMVLKGDWAKCMKDYLTRRAGEGSQSTGARLTEDEFFEHAVKAPILATCPALVQVLKFSEKRTSLGNTSTSKTGTTLWRGASLRPTR
ncbi:hypothetical protein CLAIMM_14334 [Cladophialophora immunda]|nr:hypothetical protein CLAIMM_14334 [Cladophialophora immunda]